MKHVQQLNDHVVIVLVVQLLVHDVHHPDRVSWRQQQRTQQYLHYPVSVKDWIGQQEYHEDQERGDCEELVEEKVRDS